ncbi:hypothetical protein [Nitrosomonas oligotropha]|uniref:hypothetical protein n=1 Tax=Nitrosomonas oligotropha TaxID=42354 RepID=UPI0015E6687A|nr:hypothetical protein [Nitrosomonas oligotropha]
MSAGKYLSLEEARKEKKIDRFCNEHPSEGKEDEFDCILEAMIKPKDDSKNSAADAET